MLLLSVQHKLFHLDGNVIVDFIVALRMFTRSLILKRRVEDLQLGVESYQKKLTSPKPLKDLSRDEFKETLHSAFVHQELFMKTWDNYKKGICELMELYSSRMAQLKLFAMRFIYKVHVFRLDYNTEMPKRKWTAIDRKRSGLMIELIDKQLREREIIRNLERLVGARELEMDYKLMMRIV
ncbi:hypothetical protein Tco_0320689 [Tanacetum coccineum]